MANLVGKKEWSNVYQIEQDDRVYANPNNEDDIANRQAQALLNRTEYLNDNLKKPINTTLDLGNF